MFARVVAVAAFALPCATAMGPFGRAKPAHPHIPGAVPRTAGVRPTAQPGSANCTTNFFTQTIDHFSWLAPPLGSFTYPQRYLTYDQFWNKDSGVVFFYAGEWLGGGSRAAPAPALT